MASGLRLTAEQYAELMRKRASEKPPASVAVPVAAEVGEEQRIVRAHRSMERFRALGRLPKDRMNQTEAAFADYLEEEKRAGRVRWWKFHPVRVRLADNTFYEVDFLVMHADFVLCIYETKGGYTTDKGQLKLKLCGEVLPIFRMFKATKLAKKRGGGWEIEEFSG